MLPIPVLAYDITNLTDARYFAAWGVDYIGFELAEGQPTQVADPLLLAIREWVEGPGILGSFQLESSEVITARANDLQLEAVLLPPFVSMEHLAALKNITTVLQRVSLVDTNDLVGFLEARKDLVGGFVLESALPWADLPVHVRDTVQEMAARHKLFLGASLEIAELTQLRADCPTLGLALRGGEEEKVGYKSYDELDDVFDLLLG